MSAPALPVLTAVTGAWEAALVSGLERAGGDVVVVRRCVDLPDLIATAGTGQARAVVVSADLRRLDGEALSQLASAQVAVVGLVDPGDEAGRAPAAPARGRRGAARGRGGRGGGRGGRPRGGSGRRSGRLDRGRARRPGPARADVDHLADPARALAAVPDRAGADTERTGAPSGGGRGWSPCGDRPARPGGTTVAVTLAAELAGRGQSSLLVDADTYGGSVAQVLGLLDEAPGLAAAARAADHGTLDLEHLARAAPVVLPGLRVLTGIARPPALARAAPGGARPGVRPARLLCDWTVVDCGFSIEQDEELIYDTAAPRRNGATLVSLEQADVVVAVGAADPVGLGSVWCAGLVELAELVPGRSARWSSSTGCGARPSAAAPSTACATRSSATPGTAEPVLVPDDRPAAGRRPARRPDAHRERAVLPGPAGDRRAGASPCSTADPDASPATSRSRGRGARSRLTPSGE